jgi:NAD(P)H-dependent FMN reductase
MTVVGVIVGSTRQGRFCDKPAAWIRQRLSKRPGVEARLLDLRDFPMPFFDEAVPPAMPGRPAYAHEAVRRWTAAVGSADAFVVVTPEYNHGYPAVLKNALDYVYAEWVRKPVAFVSYGNVGGGRVVQQLRQVVVELQMAPLRQAVHVPVDILMGHFQGHDVGERLSELDGPADAMIDDLLWWTGALGSAREAA